MLSILIPVYNYSVVYLVKSLHQQGLQLNIPFEILVVDDNSHFTFNDENSQVNELKNVSYIRLEKNIGRSRIRNILAQKAKFEYLLFMDCDARVPSKDYLQNYIDNCLGNVVLCGGTDYDKNLPSPSCQLRWHYGISREKRTAEERSIEPNSSFTTFNFLISKEIFNQVGFDESLNRYGHEDTLFGIELKRKGFEVQHIDNPLIHIGLDSNKDFVFKTKQSVKNLHILVKEHECNDLYNSIKILSYYKKLKDLRLVGLLGFIYKIVHAPLEKRIILKNNLLYFDLLKIGYLCTLK